MDIKRQPFRFCPHCRAGLDKKKIEGKKRAFCPECGWVRYQNPLPSVAAVVWNESGKILFVKRGVEPAKGKWALPSGFIEIDETPQEACLRELKEETGLQGHIVGLTGVVNQRSFLYKNVLIIGYEVRASGALRAGSDSEDAEFFSMNNIPRIAFPSHRELIERAVRRKDL
jgi:8-oxo-dGTP diphosphatase